LWKQVQCKQPNVMEVQWNDISHLSAFHFKLIVIIMSFIYATEYTTRVKFTLKVYIKMFLHVSVNKQSSGSLLLCFAKVMFIKIVG
jgi:hypothetical protein